MIGASVKRLLFAVLAAAILACFLPSYSLFTRDLAIDAGAIEKHGEFSYLAKLPFSSDAVMAADGPNSPFASTVILYENGKRIGWPHSLHEVIDKVGLGTFSHWGNLSESVLIFSSSDNTDPRTNGRSYRIAALHKAPNPVFILLALPLLVFLLDRAIGEKWMPLFQTLSIAGLLAIWVNLLHGFIAYYPDSLTYYYWLRIVPLGYCLFLGAVGSLVWVTDVQLCMLWGAVLFLCLAVNQISIAAGLATLILLASSTHWSYQQASILSEGLFLPLLLVNVGAAIFAITSPGKRRWPIIAALSAAGLMFVRPAGYYALLGVFFLLIAMWSRFALKWLLAPFVIFLAATITINFAVRGPGAQSSVGRVLFPLVVLLYEPQFSPDSDREFGMAAASAVEAYRAKFKQAGSAIDRAQFLADNYNPISLVAERAIVTTVMASSGIGNDVNAFRTRMEGLQLRLFLQTVSNNPLGYLNLVGDQLVWAWEKCILAYYHPPHRSMAAETGLLAYRQKVLATHKVPQETSVLIPDIARYTGFSAALLDELSNTYRNIQTERWLVYLLGLVTFAAPFAFFIRSRRILALGYCGVMIHGSVLLTCTTTVFIGRYAMPVDPILLVAAAILIDGLISVGVSQLRKLRAPKARPTLQESPA